MPCIFCTKEFDSDCRLETKEHIFPESIGGSLTIFSVCKPCNNELGSKVDPTISDYFPILVKREQLNIGGKRGRVPSVLELLLGNAQFVEDPAQKVRMRRNTKTGKFETYLLPKVTRQSSKDGTAIQIVLDARDRGKIPEILGKVLSRTGTPVSQDKLTEIMQSSITSTINNPVLKSSQKIRMPDYRLGMAKVTYELAWRWLGNDWLSDPSAVKLRKILTFQLPVDDAELRGWVGTSDELSLLSYLQLKAFSHYAFSFVSHGLAVIVVKIFDCIASVFVITENWSKYNADGNLSAGFFVELDPIKKTLQEGTSQDGMMAHGNWELIMPNDAAEDMRRRMGGGWPARA